jgi:minor extracellular serine protease Vpr
MFAGFEQRKMILALVLLITLAAGSLYAATLDPLLQGLARDKAADTTPSLVYHRFLAIDSRANSADPTVGVILHKEAGRVDLSAVPGLVVGSRSDGFVTARLPLSSLPWLEANEDISHVEAARLMLPLMDAARADGRVEEVWNGAPAYTGEGVLVGVIDSGIDWNHADFDDPSGDTRIQYIWDLYVETGTPPTGFDFGTEYNASQINAGTCTEVDISGHGTHVAGIAAGNGFESAGVYSGVAPEASIIFAKAYDDNQHGFPGDMVINAMNYLAGKAAGNPMTINMSLGGHMGPHDGTSAQEQLIDDLSGVGIVFCVAAGNEGEMFLHDSGSASGTNLLLNIDTIDGSTNDYVLLNIWVDGSSSPSVSLTYGGTTIGPVASGQQDGFAGSYGTVVIDNATGSNTNGDKQMIIQLDDQNGTAPGLGNWTINISGGSGTAHAWVAVSNMNATFTNSDQSFSVGMPGTSEAAISVAAHKTKGTWTSLHGDVGYGGDWAFISDGDHAPFSSVGPTRDGREKPDLSAPGMGVFAPYSSDTSPYPGDAWVDPDVNYVFSQGTSMATPFVCGVAALMLEKNSTLTAAQIKTILRESAVVDSFTGDVWNNYFGAGKVDAMAAVQAVSDLGPPPTGDVNGDETTTVLDLVLLANHIADPSGYPLESDARQQGDVYPSPSGDGLLNASDLARIVSFILESDEPGYAPPILEAVHFELAQATWRDGRWWQSISITGDGIVAGQFALNLEGAVWQPEDLECESGVQVTAGVAGTQLRVLLYDLGGNFPADGVTVQVPFDFSAEQPGIARCAGVLMVDGTGAPLDVRETSFQPAGFLRVSPNPAPGDMVVSFARQSGRNYELSVFDLRGRRVRGIGRGNGHGSESNGSVIFDGRDDGGRLLPAGIYFVRLNSEGHTFSTKVILTR